MEDRIREFEKFNETLREKYKKIDKSHIKADLSTVGELYQAKKLTVEELAVYKTNSIAAVDGSVNSFGGDEPNVISLLSACYLPDLKRERLEINKIISPLAGSYENPKDELARLEVLVAIQGLEKFKSHALFMDGGFIRFLTNAEDDFHDLVQVANKNKCLVVGIIEDMKSKVVAESLGIDAYDREIVFGALDYGQALILNSKHRKNTEVGTAYIRSAMSPQPVAIDYNISDEKRIREALDLIFTMTPESGRGIPYIIDMVDKYARITDRELEAFIKTYIDEDLRRIYLDQARKKRWM